MLTSNDDALCDACQTLERLDSRRRIGVWLMYISLAVPCLFFIAQLIFMVVYLFQGNKPPLPFGTIWTAPSLFGGFALVGMLIVMPIGGFVRGVYSKKLERFAARSGMTCLDRLPSLRTGESLSWTKVLAGSELELHLSRPRLVLIVGVLKLFGALCCAAFAAWIIYQVLSGNAPGRFFHACGMVGAMIAAIWMLLSMAYLQWVAPMDRSGGLTAELVRLCFFRVAVEIPSEAISHFELRSGVLRLFRKASEPREGDHGSGFNRRASAIPLLRAGRGLVGQVRSQRVIQSLLNVLHLNQGFPFTIVVKDRVHTRRISRNTMITPDQPE